MPILIESVGATEILVRNEERIRRLTDLRPEMDAAVSIVRENTQSWYDSDGAGTWAPLAQSTIDRKTSTGYPDPERILYAEGNLYESVVSDAGPYSSKVTSSHEAIITVDWEENGYQIPVVLSEGTNSAGRGNTTVIPARPIWPEDGSIDDTAIRAEIGALLIGTLDVLR